MADYGLSTGPLRPTPQFFGFHQDVLGKDRDVRESERIAIWFALFAHDALERVEVRKRTR